MRYIVFVFLVMLSISMVYCEDRDVLLYQHRDGWTFIHPSGNTSNLTFAEDIVREIKEVYLRYGDRVFWFRKVLGRWHFSVYNPEDYYTVKRYRKMSVPANKDSRGNVYLEMLGNKDKKNLYKVKNTKVIIHSKREIRKRIPLSVKRKTDELRNMIKEELRNTKLMKYALVGFEIYSLITIMKPVNYRTKGLVARFLQVRKTAQKMKKLSSRFRRWDLMGKAVRGRMNLIRKKVTEFCVYEALRNPKYTSYWSNLEASIQRNLFK